MMALRADRVQLQPHSIATANNLERDARDTRGAGFAIMQSFSNPAFTT